MDSKTVFVRTSKGDGELKSSVALLSGDIRRALVMVDGFTTVAEIQKHAAPSLRSHLEALLNDLLRNGYILDRSKAPNMPKLAVPKRQADRSEEVHELDFTAAFKPPTPEVLAAEAAKAEAARKAAEASAPAAVVAATAAPTPSAAEVEAERARQQAVLEQQVRAEAEKRAQALAEEMRQKMECEAAARVQAELEAARAKAEAEAQARAEAEERARVAEKRARQEAELERLKARQVMLDQAEKAEKAAREAAQKEAAQREALERQIHEQRLERELAERQARVLLERQAKEAAELLAKQEREAQALAERRVSELIAQQARELAERQAKELAERQAREQAVREQAERLAQQEREARELAERQARLEREAREQAERRARELAEQQAQERAVREQAERLAQQEREARELAERQARLEREAREQAEQQAQERAVREQAERVAQQERAARELIEQQAKERAAREEAERVAEQARVAREFAEQQDRQAQEARELAEQQAREAVPPPAGVTSSKPAAELMLQTAHGTWRAFPTRGTEGESRTVTVTVLFFDMVAYSKQSVHKQTALKKLFNQMVSICLKSLDEKDEEFIILDTGDGAAVGFTQHPEDALEAAMHFRRLVTSEPEYAELRVRMGIHLGPVNVMTDMNGKPNMVGSGINDAQRVMDFAGTNQIFISRAYFDFVSRLSEEYGELFVYRGVRQDKHGFEHPVYELVDPMEPQAASPLSSEKLVALQLDPVQLQNLAPPPETTAYCPIEITLDEIEEEQPVAPPPVKAAKGPLIELFDLDELEESEKPIVLDTEAIRQAQEQADKLAQLQEIEERRRVAAEEAEAKKLAEAQTKAWKQAERRAQEAAKANAERAVKQEAAIQAPSGKVLKVQQPNVVAAAVVAAPQRDGRRRWLMGAGLVVLLLLLAWVGPMLIPTGEYERKLEQSLSEQLQQPVRIAQVDVRLLPAPQVVLHELILGRDSLIRVNQATANLSLFSLFSQKKVVSHLLLEDVRVPVAQLESLGSWLEVLPRSQAHVIRAVEISRAVLDVDTFNIGGIHGQLRFDAGGTLLDGELQSGLGESSLSLNQDAGRKTFSLRLRAGVLPFIPRWAFEELRLKGSFANGQIQGQQMTGDILGGFLSGHMNLAWQAGWLVDGEVEVERLDAEKFSNLLTGSGQVKGRFKLQSAQFSNLLSSFSLNGSFALEKGQFKGVDMLEAMRSRGDFRSAGGRTSFDRLSGNLLCANRVCQFKQINLQRGALNATGDVTVALVRKNGTNASGHEINGRLTAKLTSSDAQAPVSFALGGTLERLEVSQ